MKVPQSILLFAASLLLCWSCGSKSQDSNLPPSNQRADSAQQQVAAGLLQDDVQSSEAADEEHYLHATDAESGWAASYRGKLDGKIELSLKMNGLGDYVRGELIYTKSGKPIIVLGTFDNDGTFFLREFQPDGNITGVLSGHEKGGKLSGSWYAPGTEKEMKLEMDVETVQEEGSVEWPFSTAKNFAGKYGYHYGKDGYLGSMTVKQEGNRIKFEMNCLTGEPGRNMALVQDAEGSLQGHTVLYKMPELECEFKIDFFDGFAIVAFVDEKTDCEFGHNATIEGEFLKLK